MLDGELVVYVGVCNRRVYPDDVVTAVPSAHMWDGTRSVRPEELV